MANCESDESDVELPPDHRYVVARLKDNEYLKLFQMKNGLHDQDREKAACITQNLVIPHRKVIELNPFLNHVPKDE